VPPLRLEREFQYLMPLGYFLDEQSVTGCANDNLTN
jgi:hypothetical protein